MADELKRVGIKLTADGARDFKAELKECSAATRENYSELKLAQSQYDKNTKSVEKLKDRQEYLTKQADVYKDKVKILNQQLKEMEAAENRDETAISKKRAELNQAEAKLNGYEKSLKEVNKQLDTGAAKLKEWGEKVKGVGGKMQSIGNTMTTHITAPITAGAAGAVVAFNEVDEALDTVAEKTGASGKQLEGMETITKRIATTIPVSFGEAGNAVGEVNTRFGLTGRSLEDLSQRFLKFSKLNKTDVSDSIDSTQKALSAFGLDARSAGSFLDVLNRTGQTTGVSMETLLEGLVQNGTAFQEMGMNIHQSTVFMGQLEKSGANSETVMNGLRKALKNATEDGIPMNEALKNLQETIKNGKGGMDGLTAAYKLFGKSGDQVYAAVKNGSIDFTDLANTENILSESTESVGKTYEKTKDPIDDVKTAMNDAKIIGFELVKTAAPMLKTALEGLRDVLKSVREWWSGLSEEQQKNVLKFAAIAAAAGPVLSVLGSLVTVIGGIATAAGVVAPVLGTIAAGIGAIGAPVIAVVAVIGGLIAALVTVVKHWKDIKKAAGDFVKGVKEKWEGFKKATKETVDNTVKKWNQWKKETGQKISDTAKGAKKKFDEIKKNAGTAFENVKKSAGEKLGQARQKAIDAFDKIRTGAADKLGTAKQKATDAFEALRKGAKDKLDQAGKTAGTAFEFIKNSASDKLGQAKQTASNIFDKIKGFAKFSWHLPKLGVKAISGLVNFVKGIIKKVRDAFKFKWSLPKLKLPHPKITGHFSLNPPSVPHFSIRWYKDAYQRAAYYNSPTVRADGRGFGDGHGGEFAVGEKHLRDVIREETYNPVNVTYGDVNINVYSSPGQDVRKLAEEVSRRLATVYERERAVWT